MKVYLLWHQCNDDDEGKLVGIFSSEGKARHAITAQLEKPGFKSHPEGFTTDKYDIDETEWQEGFVTMRY